MKITGFAIVEPNGTIRFPIYLEKKKAIETFLGQSMISWKECIKIGWKCKKVEVSLSK